MERPLCRHCSRSKVNRPRGLCWHCYHLPGVRELYPFRMPQYTRRGLGRGTGPSLTPSPTRTLPGTEQRITVLTRRAMLHQADAEHED